jgi:hypothetical protein
MNIKEFSSQISIKEAVAKIELNKSRAYQWYAVKNSKGCPFELGGSNYNNNLAVKAYIPRFDSNLEAEFLPNGMINSDYSLEDYRVEFRNKIYSVAFGSTKKLLEYLNRIDFRIHPPKIVEKQKTVIKYYSEIKLYGKKI